MTKRKALVTGSSRGIGRAIAIDLGKKGAEVFVHYAKNADKAEEVKEIIEKNGGTAHILRADLTKPEASKDLIKQTGGIDILVINASVQIKKPYEEITTEDTIMQLNCNFVSSLHLIQSAVPYMKENNWGRIVTIGSVQEVKPHPQMLVYSASKAAQTNMVKSLSLQLAEFGITVNNVAPGVIYTDRNIDALSDKTYAKTVTDSIPSKFYGKPEDCASMVSLLCSDDARYITGQSIFIDGGKSIL